MLTSPGKPMGGNKNGTTGTSIDTGGIDLYTEDGVQLLAEDSQGLEAEQES